MGDLKSWNSNNLIQPITTVGFDGDVSFIDRARKNMEYFHKDNVISEQQAKLAKYKQDELPSRVYTSKEATVLIWKDGTKTIVRRTSDDEHDPRVAFLTAYFQKHCGLSKNKANKYLAQFKEEETGSFEELIEKAAKKVVLKNGN